jgi:hypothetical protein
MKFISHRGNWCGKDKTQENLPDVIAARITQGYSVEVDVWGHNNKLFLGHDLPDIEVSLQFFKTYYNKLYVHCKNDAALFALSHIPVLELFSHTNDPFTISSKRTILINPHTNTNQRNGILMMPEMSNYSVEEILQFDGIITDNIKFYEDCFNSVGKQ